MTTEKVISSLMKVCVKHQLHPTQLQESCDWTIKKFGLDTTTSHLILQTQRQLWVSHPQGYL